MTGGPTLIGFTAGVPVDAITPDAIPTLRLGAAETTTNAEMAERLLASHEGATLELDESVVVENVVAGNPFFPLVNYGVIKR